MTASRRAIVSASLATLIAFALLIGLGVWQLERKAWKENLIGQLTERLAAAPQPLPPLAQWPSLAQAQNEFRHINLRGTFNAGETALVYAAPSALRPDVSGPGYWVFAPAHLSGGGVVVVNRGFVPVERKDAAPPSGTIDITGTLRWPEQPGLFTPAPSSGVWYARDHNAIAAAKNWSAVAPFYIEQEAPQAAGAPKVGPMIVRLPDNHLQYAITWFGLAAALAGVFLIWLRGRLRPRRA